MYSRVPLIDTEEGPRHMKRWLRDEWKRSGLPLRNANDACGVKDAATRKYFDQGWLWYVPPQEIMEQLVAYANQYGDPKGCPYYSIDGFRPVTGEQWASLRYKWNYRHGIVNVWDRPSLRGAERYRGSGRRSAPRVYRPTKHSTTHLNQKPLEFMNWIVGACTDPGDVVWEPFGGLASASVAAVGLGRDACVAEQVEHFADLAEERLSAVGLGQGELGSES